MKVRSGGVLAALYKGGLLSRNARNKSFLHHAYKEGEEVTLCGKIKVEHLADNDLDAPPTCKTCLKRDPRFN
jgi:hypothetical protein